MNWQSAVQRTVTGLGYDLVDAEKSVGGLLRVFIDHLPDAAHGQVAERFINVDDCEKVTRQLQHVLEVEGCAYERLEVSSPGLDRPLKKAADYARFAGAQIELTLKLPFKGRKKYRGELQAQPGQAGTGWRLLLGAEDAKGSATRAARRAAAKPAEADSASAGPHGMDRALDFSLEEVREARLVPVVDFKGRRADGGDAPRAAPGAGVNSDDEVDGGRIQ
ncbi:MAG: ribosome maturation factor RimP [Burkholderiales bacterium]|nr:ribosome maturation factor RimP [Burkholderiales bacterium]